MFDLVCFDKGPPISNTRTPVFVDFLESITVENIKQTHLFWIW